jgi:hypothetical protein
VTVDLDALLCHCDHDPDGHELADCGTTVKSGSYGRDKIRGLGDSTGATGTCPKCERTGVKVRRAKIVTSDRRDLHPLIVGVVVAIRPALAPHKTPGRAGGPCEGAGELPAETRWHSAAYDAMVHDCGLDAVTLK